MNKIDLEVKHLIRNTGPVFLFVLTFHGTQFLPYKWSTNKRFAIAVKLVTSYGEEDIAAKVRIILEFVLKPTKEAI